MQLLSVQICMSETEAHHTQSEQLTVKPAGRHIVEFSSTSSPLCDLHYKLYNSRINVQVYLIKRPDTWLAWILFVLCVLQVVWEQQELWCTVSVPSTKGKPDNPSCRWGHVSLLRASLSLPLFLESLSQRWNARNEDPINPTNPITASDQIQRGVCLIELNNVWRLQHCSDNRA